MLRRQRQQLWAMDANAQQYNPRMPFTNCYADAARAEAYARLEFANTYYLAYRDLPALLAKHTTGKQALDFGCGAGRSTRFVRGLGFDAIGVDIAPEMIAKARELDPAGDYRLVPDDDFSALPAAAFDLVLSLFTFDNIAAELKPRLFRDLARLLNPAGKLVNVVSSPEIYLHEWASFSTRDFLEQNRAARSGDPVEIVTTELPDRRPTVDILCTPEAYAELYAQAGLSIVEVLHPLATGAEPYPWVNETRIAPWTIYVLGRH